MAALRRTVGRAWRALERFVESRRATPTVFLVALAVYGAVSIALPLQAGRDLPRYLLHYAQLFDAHVVYPSALVTRTPGTPLVDGALLEAGPVVSEVGAGVLYALSIVCWFVVSRRFGSAAAIATAAALLVYPGYVLLFHQLASDALFAAAFALVALLLARAVELPTIARAALLGAGVAGLVLVRPVGQVLLVLGLVPLLVARGWGGRIRCAAAFAVAALMPLLAVAGHNAIRGDDLALVRGGSAALLFRTFVADRIVEPENGEASEELARAVARELLPQEPYRSRNIDLHTFFSSGSARMQEDFIVLADRRWGWDDDYQHLGRVAREAVRAHPSRYARGVARDFRRLLLWPLYAPVEVGAASEQPPAGTAPSAASGDDGELIPSSREAPYLSTPDGRIREVWTSPDTHSIVFRDPEDRIRADEVDREVLELLGGLPDRAQRPELVRVVNDASRWFPRPFMWLLLGLVAVLVRRPRGMVVPLSLAGTGFLILLATSLVVYAVAEYSVPVTPAFILLATTGLLGRRAA